LRILTRSAAYPRFAPGLASPVPVRSVATITTHYGQFAALPGASRVVRRALRFAAAPIIGKNQSDICGGGAAKDYLIANSAFAREAPPLPCFGHRRTSVNAPRVAAGDATLHARSHATLSSVEIALSGMEIASGPRSLRRALRMSRPKGTPATICWSSRCCERLRPCGQGTPIRRRRI
jgi:hypothetical protein